MTFINRKNELEKKIELLRKEMVNIATEKGYTSEESIKLSQQLDDLISEYIDLKQKEKRMLN